MVAMGAFESDDAEAWINKFDVGIFARSLKMWLQLPNLSQCTVIDLKDSPAAKFAKFLGLGHVQSKLNTASSEELLGFLVKNKQILGEKFIIRLSNLSSMMN